MRFSEVAAADVDEISTFNKIRIQRHSRKAIRGRFRRERVEERRTRRIALAATYLVSILNY
jgi:hypothetical protein